MNTINCSSSPIAAGYEGDESGRNEMVLGWFYAFLLGFCLLFYQQVQAAPEGCTGFRTQTQGGWGASPSGNNPGAYLHAHFSSAFPGGVSIGGCGNTLVLTSAQAATDFLPSGSTAGALPTGTLTNPGGSYTNVLAGQAVTLSLSIGFDAADAAFSSNTGSLAALILTSGAFSGWTVSQVLAEANKVLGGCASAYTAAELNAALTAINENYDNGTVDKGFLRCNTVPPLILTLLSSSDASCYGASDGTITVSVSGGVAPYTIHWSNGASTAAITGLSAGTYTVTVSDASAQTKTLSVNVGEPAALALSETHTDVSCYAGANGTIDLSVSGGSAPYSYQWTGSTAAQDVDQLTAGSYTVLVHDAHGCTSQLTVVITQPALLLPEVSVSNVNCYGGSDGAIYIGATGGTAPYSYSQGDAACTQNLSGLSAGTYSFNIYDAHGCSTQTTVVVSQPDKLETYISGTHVRCYGDSNGALNLSVTGGSTPYSYAWTNGATSEDISGVPAGAYTVTVQDAHGCVTVAAATLTQPSDLLLSETHVAVTAFGGNNGSINLSVTGGTPNYGYSWSNGSGAEDQASLYAGTYTVWVTDAHSCKKSTAVVITQPPCSSIGLKTITQGGWGAKPSGNNPGTYLYARFASAFPGGLTVGACGKTLTLTSATAVTNFLPSGSTARALTASLVNPTKASYSNVLAGQVVALALNVGFDVADPAFAPATTLLGALVVSTGPFAGKTVFQVLDEANKVLGGCPSVYTAAQLNTIVTQINENYDGGLVNKGVLTCPTASGTTRKAATVAITNTDMKFSVFPNPFPGTITLRFIALQNDQARVEVLDLNGRLIATAFKGSVNEGQEYSVDFKGENLADGIYLARIVVGESSVSRKIILQR